MPNEGRRILAVAREYPDLSSRQLSAWITDHEGFAVSESTVYRILKREGKGSATHYRMIIGWLSDAYRMIFDEIIKLKS